MSWTSPHFRPRHKPVTLGSMRAGGLRSVLAYCGNPGCGHGGSVNVDAWADDVVLGDLQRRMRCQVCGHLGADVRPNFSDAIDYATSTGCRVR
jgi:hypothetical protein